MAILCHYINPGSSPEHVTHIIPNRTFWEKKQKLVCLSTPRKNQLLLLRILQEKGHNILIFKQDLEGQTYDLISQMGYLKFQNSPYYILDSF